MKTKLLNKIKKRQARVGVLGIGYVGVPLLARIAEIGFEATGFDVINEKVKALNRGDDVSVDVEPGIIKKLVKKKKLGATTNFKLLSKMDIIIIAVPTPLTPQKTPDISMLNSAVNEIQKYIRRGQLIILESTTYPGTTDEILKTSFSKNGFVTGKDYFLAFSPERIDPGNPVYKFHNTPKVVGGCTSNCTAITTAFYKTLVEKVVPVKDTRTAEMSKLLENIYRNVNIALVNELMMVCDRMGLDIWEIIEAAKTKPFGFMPFYPGPGVGGHCIPVDPFYLSWKAREYGLFVDFILVSAETNENVPYYVVEKILKNLIKIKKKSNEIKILLMGMTFKPDIDDLRMSPSTKILDLLDKHPFKVMYHDPYFSEVSVKNKKYRSVSKLYPAVRSADMVVILTPHSSYDIEKIVKESGIVVDTRNATSKFIKKYSNIIRI